MKRFGRLTIYGEYLMHNITCGFIAKSCQYLATSEHFKSPIHNQYDPEKDEVNKYLSHKGYQTQKKFRGDLPLGYGLGGSSILTGLHLNGQENHRTIEKIIYEVDHAIHGFVPSGVDTYSYFKQCDGFYGMGKWHNTSLRICDYLLVTFPKSHELPLEEIRQRVLAEALVLSKLSNLLTANIKKSAKLDYALFFEYCNVLSSLDVYSEEVQHFIVEMLNYGIPTKGIGGLYQKAVMLFPRNESDKQIFNKKVNQYGYKSIFKGKIGNK